MNNLVIHSIIQIFYLLTKYVQSRLLQISCLWVNYYMFSCFLQGASSGYPVVIQPVPRRWQNGIQHLTKMMNLKKLKRRLSLTFKGNRSIDSSLSDLAEQMTIEDSNGFKENGAGNIEGRLSFIITFSQIQQIDLEVSTSPT